MTPPGRLSNLWHIPGRAWTAALKAANVTLWWRFGAALVVTGLIGLLIWIIWQGPWSAGVEPERLDWLGWFGVLLIVALIICVVALFDFRVALQASRSGISLQADGDHDDPAPLAQVTTTTTVAAAPGTAASADEGELPPDQRVKL